MSREIVIRISVPEGVATPVVDYTESEPPHPASAAPQAAAKPSCPDHGPMLFKKGTSKAGNAYAGYFCEEEGCNTAPVWTKVR